MVVVVVLVVIVLILTFLYLYSICILFKLDCSFFELKSIAVDRSTLKHINPNLWYSISKAMASRL